VPQRHRDAGEEVLDFKASRGDHNRRQCHPMAALSSLAASLTGLDTFREPLLYDAQDSPG